MSENKTSKAQREAIERYEKSIDRYLLRMPKGTKAKLEKYALEHGYVTNGKPSLNKLINEIITEYLK